MAQKVNIVLVDDLDGSEASQTVSFGLDGTTYEIDLGDKNAAALREALAGYIGHARKVGGAGRRGRRTTVTALGPSSSVGKTRGRASSGRSWVYLSGSSPVRSKTDPVTKAAAPTPIPR